MGTKTLSTERLVLRWFKPEDAQLMLENWAGSENVTKYMTWPPYTDVSDVLQYINSIISTYESNDTYYWVIELKEISQPVGCISAVSANWDIGLVHIGYCIGEKWWHKGITSEAFAEVIRFFMEEIGVNKVESRHDPRNVNSGKVMQKCGLKYEGTLRRSDFNNQGICDSAYYGLLREEYYNKK